jgi:hypothetical protein
MLQKIKDEDRKKIPEEIRCMMSYNGYHAWEIVKEDGDGVWVLCLKCLAKKKIDLEDEEEA